MSESPKYPCPRMRQLRGTGQNYNLVELEHTTHSNCCAGQLYPLNHPDPAKLYN